MKDETRAHTSEAADQTAGSSPPARDSSTAAERPVPTEPFPCPHCGQMLAPTVRVCVACREPVDSLPIAVAAPPDAPPLGADSFHRAPQVRFSWSIFLGVLAAWLLVASVFVAKLGPEKAQLAVMAVVVLSSAWVAFDAHEKAIPRPMSWALGSLLFWIVFFPWYLSRRRQPQAACPLMEAESRPWLRTLLLVLLIAVLVSLLLVAVRGPLPKH
jgi:hypothetical protein